MEESNSEGNIKDRIGFKNIKKEFGRYTENQDQGFS